MHQTPPIEGAESKMRILWVGWIWMYAFAEERPNHPVEYLLGDPIGGVLRAIN